MKCDYKKCQNDASTKGRIWSNRIKEFVPVVYCKKHRKRPEFLTLTKRTSEHLQLNRGESNVI